MGGHRGVPEPYIILEECVGEAIYDSPEDGENAKGQSPELPTPPPKDARQDKKPGSK
jgi:hypothetical protein